MWHPSTRSASPARRVTRWTGTLAAVITVLALVAVSSPADAQTRKVRDAAGDSYTPSLDFRSATYANTAGELKASARVKRLTRHSAFSFDIYPRDFSDPYAAILRWRNGKVRAQLWDLENHGPGTKIRCNVSTRWQPRKDTVAVRVPTSCLPIPTRALQLYFTGWDLRNDTISDSTRPLLVRRG